MRKIWVVVVLGAVALLSACAPTTEPEPFHLPTATASRGSDDVADAIAVYEEYVAATNRLVVADEGTWDAVLRLTSGAFQESLQKDIEGLKTAGVVLSGDVEVISTTTESATKDLVVLRSCVDVSKTTAVDQFGQPAVDPTRTPIQVRTVRLSPLKESGEWKIINVLQVSAGDQC